MNETIAIVIFLVAATVALAFIIIVVRQFLHDERHDYIEHKDYTLKDFYTRKRQ